MLIQLDLISGFLNHLAINEFDFGLIYETMIEDILSQIAITDLSLRDSLTISMIIIGSKKVDKYITAFFLLKKWEDIGGAYWLVQR